MTLTLSDKFQNGNKLNKFNTGLEVSLEFLFFIDVSFQGTIIKLQYSGLIDKILIWSYKEQPVLNTK